MDLREKCKICGMKTYNTYITQDIYDEDIKVPCCDVCYGKYGDKHIHQALKLGSYGKEKVVLNR